jgi:hypothetical protein
MQVSIGKMTLREELDRELTHAELDGNFKQLNNDDYRLEYHINSENLAQNEEIVINLYKMDTPAFEDAIEEFDVYADGTFKNPKTYPLDNDSYNYDNDGLEHRCRFTSYDGYTVSIYGNMPIQQESDFFITSWFDSWDEVTQEVTFGVKIRCHQNFEFLFSVYVPRLSNGRVLGDISVQPRPIIEG